MFVGTMFVEVKFIYGIKTISERVESGVLQECAMKTTLDMIIS